MHVVVNVLASNGGSFRTGLTGFRHDALVTELVGFLSETCFDLLRVSVIKLAVLDGG